MLITRATSCQRYVRKLLDHVLLIHILAIFELNVMTTYRVLRRADTSGS